MLVIVVHGMFHSRNLHLYSLDFFCYFRHHLERAYRLCPPCEEVLKQTLLKQKSVLLGFSLKQLHSTSLYGKVSAFCIILLKN
jgi:hypothetical protein